MVFSMVMYVPPIAGSDMRLKNAIWATNITWKCGGESAHVGLDYVGLDQVTVPVSMPASVPVPVPAPS